MQNSQPEPPMRQRPPIPDGKPGRFAGRNLLVILVILLIAAALIAISVLSGGGQMTKEEIDAQISALASPTPAPQTAAQTEEASDQTAAAEEPKAYLFILLNSRIWAAEPLGDEREITVDQGNGVVNVIHLLPDGFYMASSTCDNQLCVAQGAVTTENYSQRILGTSVLCLPHGLDLELVIPNATADPNALDN